MTEKAEVVVTPNLYVDVVINGQKQVYELGLAEELNAKLTDALEHIKNVNKRNPE